MVQLSHPYMTTEKIIALTIVAKLCLCFLNAVQVCHNFSSKEQAFFNFMAVVTIHSDFGAQENKVSQRFPFSPHLFAMMGPDAMILVF